MGRKQNIALGEKEKCQLTIKGIINRAIRQHGLRAIELQFNYLKENNKQQLPTPLNYRETVRLYELFINDYKNKLKV